jgi:hypothetical protein
MQVTGPGSVRVGRFVGRLGVVSLPAVGLGLDLDERVVRRHVSRLQEAGWLGKGAGIWGEGSVVWMTAQGLAGVGLPGLRPVRASPAPSPTLTDHSVLVAWSAARAQRRGRRWLSGRELALDPDRWSVAVLGERGYTRRLPDLAVWSAGAVLPFALIAESGHRRDDRQRAILEGWRDAIAIGGVYGGVRYDCAGALTAHRITNMARKVGLADPHRFLAVTQSSPEEIAAIPPATETDPEILAEPPAPLAVPERSIGPKPQPQPVEQLPVPDPPAETPEAAAERQRRLNEILGYPEPKPRRRWRR